MNICEEVVFKLTNENKTVATMESCTGGALVNEITNIPGASEVLKFSAVTYSNEYKIKMGVDENVILKYSVYSEETAKEMSKNISLFTNSNYGIGITGKINRADKCNLSGEDNVIYISIYDRDNDKYYTKVVKASPAPRKENKELIVKEALSLLKGVMKLTIE